MRVLPRNIRVQTALLIALVLLLFLSAFFAITYFSICGSLRARSENEVRDQLRTVLSEIPSDRDSAAIQSALSHHNTTAESRLHFVIVTIPAKQMIYPFRNDSLMPLQSVLAWMIEHPGRTVRYEFGGVRFRLISVYSPALIVGAVVDLTFLEEAEDSMINAFLLSLAIGLFIAILCGVAIANFTLKPLSALAQSARSISGRPMEDRSRLPHLSEVLEIEELVRAINSLLDARDSSVDQLRSFTADAAHELRTPLTVLKGELEVELRLLPAQNPQRELLESNLEEVERLIAIVQDLLYLAAMESGSERESLVGLCSIRSCVQRVVRRLSAMSIDKQIEIQIDVSELIVHADEERLVRLLYNVLLNAIQHSKSASKVAVRMDESEKEFYTLRIEDCGIGIPPADIPHIFDRFYRAGTSRSRADGGAGLGLAIAKSIADRCGFSLAIESTMDKGTTVILAIPRQSIL